MKKYFFSFIAFVVGASFFMTGCSGTGNGSGKPLSMGNTAEVLVVLQNDQQWENVIGQTIRKYLAADMYGMPQKEPIFKLLHLKASSFSDVFQKQRDILIVRIDPRLKAPKITVMHDKWAAPQLIITVSAPTTESFVQTFTTKKEFFINKFLAFERQRILTVFKTSLNDKVIAALKKEFHFTLDVPVGFYLAKSVPNFMWIRHEANRYSQGILIVSVPYRDTAQFSRDSILSVVQKYQLNEIPGPTHGSYMSIDRKFLLPKARRITHFPTGFAVEIRGLWRVEHDFMGGPFISYTFVNKNTHDLVTLFGYVYYPNHKKRDLLLQVESILYSVKFNGLNAKVKK